jgi:diadenosine tetraphosphate (Ap4A) HIT family hydrolase
MTETQDWMLDAQLARDTLFVRDGALSRVLLMNDAAYPWLILVPRRAGATEIIDLPEPDQSFLLGEGALASRAIKSLTRCDKLNVAALGNSVAQLHVHVIARFRTDAAWPRPVWGVQPPRAYGERDRQAFVAALQRAFGPDSP